MMNAFEGDLGRAIQILKPLMEQLSQAHLSHQQQPSEDNLEQHTTVNTIARGVKEFLAMHSSKGGRKQVEKNAVDAVLTAACFDCQPETKLTSLSTCLGLRVDALILMKALERAKKMKENSLTFEPYQRATRKDCYRELTRELVNEYCHTDSEGGVRVDTESNRVFKIVDQETGEVEKHPMRVWNDVSWKQRHKSFQQSDMYQNHLVQNPGKTIGLTSFMANVCKYVRSPCPQSCVDVRTSQLYEYQKALRDAAQTNPVLSDNLKNCDCPTHTAAGTTCCDGLEEDANLLERAVKLSPRDFVAATLCKPVEQPML